MKTVHAAYTQETAGLNIGVAGRINSWKTKTPETKTSETKPVETKPPETKTPAPGKPAGGKPVSP